MSLRSSGLLAARQAVSIIYDRHEEELRAAAPLQVIRSHWMTWP
jgi:hypothetical protein